VQPTGKSPPPFFLQNSLHPHFLSIQYQQNDPAKTGSFVEESLFLSLSDRRRFGLLPTSYISFITLINFISFALLLRSFFLIGFRGSVTHRMSFEQD